MDIFKAGYIILQVCLGEPACEAAAAVAKQINTVDQVGSLDDSSSESNKGGDGGFFSDNLSQDLDVFESMLRNSTSKDEKCVSGDGSVLTMELSNYIGCVSVPSMEYEFESSSESTKGGGGGSFSDDLTKDSDEFESMLRNSTSESEPEPESELPKKRLTRRNQPELRPPAHRSSSPSPPPVDSRVAARLAAENANKEARIAEFEARIAKLEAQLARRTEEPTTNAATQRRVTVPQQPHPVARGEEIEAWLGALPNHDPNKTGGVHMSYNMSRPQFFLEWEGGVGRTRK